MRRVLPLLLLLACSPLAIAQNDPSWTKEPDSFRGAKFLASEAEVHTSFEIEKCWTKEPDEKTCYFYFDLADVFIEGLLTFNGDSLVEVTGVFTPERYPTVLDMFAERYDKPSAPSRDLATWKGRKVSIRLERDPKGDRRAIVDAVGTALHRWRLDSALELYEQVSDLKRLQYKNRMDSARTIYTLNNNRYEYETAKKKAEDEYQQKTRDDKIESDKHLEKVSSDHDKFKAEKYSFFSLTWNEYAASAAKRKAEEKMKAVEGL